MARDTVGTDVNDATDARRVVAVRSEPSPSNMQLRRNRRPPSREWNVGFTPTSGPDTHFGAIHHPAVLRMTNTDTRVVALAQALSPVQSADRLDGLAGVIRLLAITSTCLLMGACGGGGGGGGSDTPVATPPPAPAELAWDNGNWDQQEWK